MLFDKPQSVKRARIAHSRCVLLDRSLLIVISAETDKYGRCKYSPCNRRRAVPHPEQSQTQRLSVRKLSSRSLLVYFCSGRPETGLLPLQCCPLVWLASLCTILGAWRHMNSQRSSKAARALDKLVFGMKIINLHLQVCRMHASPTQFTTKAIGVHGEVTGAD